ncbi:hypothetical protein BJ170DRAFT_639784 [Xylariales sp. AK1849]|nr:hypothetical protein BJ170DRAFT_639784 [Xylariales sp. AK1849]
MAANKRRKLNTAEQPQVLSAFARLRQSHNERDIPTPPVEPSVSSQEINEQDASNNGSPVLNVTTIRKTSKTTRISRPVVSYEGSSASDGRFKGPSRGFPTPYVADLSDPADNLLGNHTATLTPIVQFSNFKPTKSNFQKKAGGKLYLKLSEGERLVILGSYGIQITSGKVTVSGALLKPSAHGAYWVHAPHCHALPVIRCPEEAVVEIEPLPAANSIRSLGMLSPLFRRLWDDEHQARPPRKMKQVDATYEILFTSADGPKRVMLSDLKSPPEWNREIENLTVASSFKPINAMITGPKSSGKSTFVKLLVNQFLTDFKGKRHAAHVIVMDLDPGQPEHGVPGQVSLVQVTKPLLAPSFCRPLLGSISDSGTNMIRSHTLASISPASDPKLYLEAAADLLNYYRNLFGSCSLIVNTPGWIQGTGLDLLTSLIELLRPTEVIYMATGPVDVVDSLQGSFKSGTVTKLPSQTTQYTSRTAAHLRAMQTMSYFHADIRDASKHGAASWWNPDPLSTLPPWLLRYAVPAPGILGIMCYDYQAPPELLAEAINGTVLAVVEIESYLAFRVPAAEVDRQEHMDTTDTVIDTDGSDAQPPVELVREDFTVITPEGIPFIDNGSTLDPRYSQTIGHILVRGIDTKKRVLQVLTPIPESRIEQINEKGGHVVLVSGKFDPPSWSYTEDLYHQASIGGEDEEAESNEPMEVMQEDEDDSSEPEREDPNDLNPVSAHTPWIEVLRGNQRRGIGSRVWRVRRDLGKTGNAGE